MSIKYSLYFENPDVPLLYESVTVILIDIVLRGEATHLITVLTSEKNLVPEVGLNLVNSDIFSILALILFLLIYAVYKIRKK